MVATPAAAGSFYAIIRAPPDLSWTVAVATGATIGTVIASSVLGFELFGAGRWFKRGGRRLPLAAAMVLRTIVYGAVIIAALLVFPWVYSGEEPSPFRPGIVGDVVFSISATLVFVSLTSIAQVIGPNVLGNLLTGAVLSSARGAKDRALPRSGRLNRDRGGHRQRSIPCPAFPRSSSSSPGW